MSNCRPLHGFAMSLVFAILFLSLHGPTFSAAIAPQPEIKRCASPRSLCNPAEASMFEFLDEILEPYFADTYGSVLRGDRELVWWALAGGEEGRWWWGEDNKELKPHNRITKRAPQINETEEERQQRMAKDQAAYKARLEEERRQREIEREREQKLRDENTNWPDNQRGFCCGEGFTCMGLTVDSSLVYCVAEGNYLIVTPEKVLLNIQTLDYTYENLTTGNLRNFVMPHRKEEFRYKPMRPTPVPIESKGENSGIKVTVWKMTLVGSLVFMIPHVF